MSLCEMCMFHRWITCFPTGSRSKHVWIQQPGQRPHASESDAVGTPLSVTC